MPGPRQACLGALDSGAFPSDKCLTEFPGAESGLRCFTPSLGTAQPDMDVSFVSLPTLEELKSFVLKVLCAQDRLDPQQVRLQQSLILQSGKPCGLFFQVHGPRALMTYAVWPSKEDRILFYDSTGVRFAETRFCESPELLEAA